MPSPLTRQTQAALADSEEARRRLERDLAAGQTGKKGTVPGSTAEV